MGGRRPNVYGDQCVETDVSKNVRFYAFFKKLLHFVHTIIRCLLLFDELVVGGGVKLFDEPKRLLMRDVIIYQSIPDEKELFLVGEVFIKTENMQICFFPAILKKFDNQFIFRIEVMVDRAGSYIGMRSDLTHGRTVKAILINEFQRALEDSLFFI